MTIENVYNALKAAVIYYPKNEVKHLVPQTFAVLYDPSDFDSDTLNYNRSHKDSPYFFSREWAHKKFNPSDLGWQPPIVGVANLGSSTHRTALEGRKVSRNPYDLQLVVMDRFYEKPERSDQRQQRSIHEIQRDTKRIAETIMQFVYRCEWYDVTLPGGANGMLFFPEHFMEELKTNGDITSYAEPVNMPKQKIRTQADPNFIPYKAGYENLYGTLINFNVEVPECTPKKSWEFRDYGLTYDEGYNG